MKKFDYATLPIELKCAINDYNTLGSLADQCLDAMIKLFPEQEAPVRALMEAYGEWYHNREQTKSEIIAFGFKDTDLLALAIEDHKARKN